MIASLGYHAGGLDWHDPIVAIDRLAQTGYRHVAIRPRPGVLLGDGDGVACQWDALVRAAETCRCGVLIDTECPFAIDPESADVPGPATDGDAGRAAMAWLEHWIAAAGRLPRFGRRLPVVTFTAGGSVATKGRESPPPSRPTAVDQELRLERLAQRIDQLITVAGRHDVVIALRPAVGRVIDSVASFERLTQWLSENEKADGDLGTDGDFGTGRLMLAADIGEMVAEHELPLTARLTRMRERLAVIYLCDPHLSRREDEIQGDPGGQRARYDVDHSGLAGRYDVPLGCGDVAVRRLAENLHAELPQARMIVRVENHRHLGFAAADAARGVLAGP